MSFNRSAAAVAEIIWNYFGKGNILFIHSALTAALRLVFPKN